MSEVKQMVQEENYENDGTDSAAETDIEEQEFFHNYMSTVLSSPFTLNSKFKELEKWFISYVGGLEKLKYWQRQLQYSGDDFDPMVKVHSSKCFPGLAGVYATTDIRPNTKVLNYKGLVLTETEFHALPIAYPFAIHLPLPRFDGDANDYVVVGFPASSIASQINDFHGTRGKKANVVVSYNRRHAIVSLPKVREFKDSNGKTVKTVTRGCISDRALLIKTSKRIALGYELLLNYGKKFFSPKEEEIYCSKCYHYDFTDSNPIMICDYCTSGMHVQCDTSGRFPTSIGEWLGNKSFYDRTRPYLCSIHINPFAGMGVHISESEGESEPSDTEPTDTA